MPRKSDWPPPPRMKTVCHCDISLPSAPATPAFFCSGHPRAPPRTRPALCCPRQPPRPRALLRPPQLPAPSLTPPGRLTLLFLTQQILLFVTSPVNIPLPQRFPHLGFYLIWAALCWVSVFTIGLPTPWGTEAKCQAHCHTQSLEHGLACMGQTLSPCQGPKFAHPGLRMQAAASCLPSRPTHQTAISRKQARPSFCRSESLGQSPGITRQCLWTVSAA